MFGPARFRFRFRFLPKQKRDGLGSSLLPSQGGTSPLPRDRSLELYRQGPAMLYAMGGTGRMSQLVITR